MRLTTAITSRDADITKLIEECKKLQVRVSFCVHVCLYCCSDALMHSALVFAWLQWRVERSEREYQAALGELEACNVRANDEQDKLYRDLEDAVRGVRRAEGAVEEARRERDALKLDSQVAAEAWAQEKRDLLESIDSLKRSLEFEEARHRDDAAVLRGRLADTGNQLTRSIGREEERLEELSRVRIEAGVARQRAEAAEKRVKMLQDQLHSSMRRQAPMHQ